MISKNINFQDTNFKKFFFLWIPVAITWLLIAVESPTVTAIVARFSYQEKNLAAFGAAFSIALLLESPVLMLLAASTSSVKNAKTYYSWRNFSYGLSALMSFLLGILSIPFVGNNLFIKVLNIPPEIGILATNSMFFLIPWPLAVGVRRFYQGLLIGLGQTKKLIISTVVRYITMFLTGLYFLNLNPTHKFFQEGAIAGCVSLSLGIICELFVTRFLTNSTVKHIKLQTNTLFKTSFGQMFSFYLPLALTTFVVLASQPIAILFLGYLPESINSLAVMPVVVSYIFIYRSIGMSVQEILIAWKNNHENHFTAAVSSLIIGGFLIILPFFASGIGLANIWYVNVGGLNSELSKFAGLTTILLALIPATEVFISYLRAELIAKHKNIYILFGALVELFSVLGISFLFLYSGIQNFSGAVLVCISALIARIIACTYQYFTL